MDGPIHEEDEDMLKPKKPLVLTTNRVKVLTNEDLGKVDGGGGGRTGTIPPKLEPIFER